MLEVGRLKRFARQALPSALILAYHRVTELASDPQLLSVTPAHFVEHLEVLRKYYHSLSLKALRRRQILNLWLPRSVVITFDDGYADNLYHARPLLERCGLPATVFVVAGQHDAAREFWWDDLERILLAPSTLPSTLQLDIAGRLYTWNLGAVSGQPGPWNVLEKDNPTPRHACYRELAPLLRVLDQQTRQQMMSDLADWAGLPHPGRPAYASLDPDGLQALASGGLLEVGSHTMTHPVLSSLVVEKQAAEIGESKKKLEEILGRSVTSFAYPYGGLSDYTEETVKLVRQAGFACACSNFTGWIRLGADPYQLPRFLVRNWDGDEFAKRLAGWFNA